MALGTFTPPATGGKASSFDPRMHAGKPLIVVVREFRENFTTQRFPQPRDVVIADVVDLVAGTVLPSVIWGASAIVDRLKGYAGTGEKLPLEIQKRNSASGNEYTTVEPLDGQKLALAAAWDAKNPTAIDDARAAREAEVAASAATQAPAAAPAIVGLASAPAAAPVAAAPAAAPVTQPVAPAVGGMSDAELEAAIKALD